MSKKYVVLGIIILLTAGFLWIRGENQIKPYVIKKDNYTAPVIPSEVIPEPTTAETIKTPPATETGEQNPTSHESN